MPENFLALDKVRVSFGEGNTRVEALKNVSLEFRRGALSLVMGPSGSGKTTLLSLIGCLISPDEGDVYVEGLAVNRLNDQARTAIRQTKISFVFQAFRLLHSLSVLDNVAIPFELRGIRGAAQLATARNLLDRLGLGGKINHEPGELSPGEKQRVAVARALVGNPPILLADEPTASLDAVAGKNICRILRNEVDRNGRTIVIVSHDPRWKDFADHTITLSDGQLERAELVPLS